jgi:chromate transporter
MLLPGPEAQQLATYLGWLLHRTRGGIVAGALFVLPSLLILIALSWLYMTLGQTPLVAGLFYGIKPAVTAIVVHAAHRIGSRTLRNGVLWAIAAAAFVAIFAFSVPFPAIVLGAALVGVIGSRLAPGRFATGGGHGGKAASVPPAVIGDDTPTPAHARFSARRLVMVASIGALLWALPMGLLAILMGWDHIFTQMGWFFTKAALVSFGGAYAVLPYLYQGAIEEFGWLSSSQMMDGLALGESTPGPLIMIVAFVGFVSAWGDAPFGPDALLLAGTLAAMLVTWFTFLPSFLFVFAGGPLIESTQGDLKFTAPLTAITAAVVGVIVNLAVFFGYPVLWPAGFSGGPDLVAAVIALGAAVALFRFNANVIHVIAACASLGLAARFLA